MSENEYGLDVNYFKGKLSLIVRDAGNYRPDEMYRELTRLAEAARPDDIPKILDIDGLPHFDKIAEWILNDANSVFDELTRLTMMLADKEGITVKMKITYAK